MKRYERMTKEEIISAYNSVPNGGCGECHARNWCNDITKKHTCVETITEWLNKEIKRKKVHRYELIKSPEDIDRLHNEMYSACAENGNKCKECPYYDKNDYSSASCFRNFLKEEIEVEYE